MNIDTDIATDYRALISMLRSSINVLPPDRFVNAAEWPVLFKLAREQGVYAYLYPWLAKHYAEHFSSKAKDSEATVAWRTLFLEALTQTLLRQRQISGILSSFEAEHIDVVVMKGAWLGETVYDDPAMRTMSDLDLLIRETDCDACHRLLLNLGYAAARKTLHNPLAYDQVYVHPDQTKLVELHWHVASDMIPSIPRPDITAIWQNTTAADYRGHPVKALRPADQLAHLVHHMLHHRFAVPLRSYVDIALVVQKHGDDLSPRALNDASSRWKTGLGLPFVLRLTHELLGIALTPEMHSYAPELESVRRTQALRALFDLPTAQACGGEITLLRFKSLTPLARLRLILSRIFMPRQFMMMQYPGARHMCGLPFAWFRRACDLHRLHREKIKAMLTPGTEEEHLLDNAASRADLVNWLVSS